MCQPVSAGEKAMRCHRCIRFRAHLRVKRSRCIKSDTSSVVADNSHTNYSHLSKDDRLKNVQKSRKAIRVKYELFAKK